MSIYRQRGCRAGIDRPACTVFALITRGSIRGKTMVTLSEQRRLWELWKVQRLSGTGPMESWENRLRKWDRKDALPGDLWARLYDWAKKNGHSS
jgi:hypothetical protein